MITLLIVAALSVTPTGVVPANDLPTSIPGVIMVDGTGEVKAMPDRVVLSVTLYNVDKDLGSAYSGNDRIADSAQNLLTKLGIAQENMMVTNIAVYPEYEDKEKTKVKRYRVWRYMTVIVDDLQLAGQAMDALLNSGVANVSLSGVYVKEQENKYREAWKLALDETAGHARNYADKLGARISRLEWASDSPSAYSIYRTRRSVVLGKLREEASAARDIAALQDASPDVAELLGSTTPSDTTTYNKFAGDEESDRKSVSGKMKNGRNEPKTKYAESTELPMQQRYSQAGFAVAEQTFSNRFLANVVVEPARRPGLGEEGMIFVAGVGTVRKRLDRANLTCHIYSVKKQLEEAYTESDGILQKAQIELTQLGIRENDITTANLRVTPEYENQKTGRIRRYRIDRTVVIRLDPLNVGKACASLARAGVTWINGLKYEVIDRKALEEQAREMALTDARNRASDVADAFGQRLGSLEWASENQSNYSSYLFGKSNPVITAPTVKMELNEMVASVIVYTHYTTTAQ